MLEAMPCVSARMFFGQAKKNGTGLSQKEQKQMIQDFKDGQWYHVRVRVMKNRIQAWPDKEQIVDADITGSKISVRIEVELSRPFGIATWQTTGAIKNIRIRKLKPEELVPKPAD